MIQEMEIGQIMLPCSVPIYEDTFDIKNAICVLDAFFFILSWVYFVFTEIINKRHSFSTTVADILVLTSILCLAHLYIGTMRINMIYPVITFCS